MRSTGAGLWAEGRGHPALDPCDSQPRGARVRFGRARALAREPRSHHRPISGLFLSKKSTYMLLICNEHRLLELEQPECS